MIVLLSEVLLLLPANIRLIDIKQMIMSAGHSIIVLLYNCIIAMTAQIVFLPE